MTIYAETERLILRELLPTDLDGMFELDSDPRVHRYLGNHVVKSKEESTAIIEYVRRQYEDHGIGRWAVIEKSSGAFAGWSGLKYETRDIAGYANYYDLGYRLIPSFWGKGYASESALAAIDYAFDQLKLEELIGAAHVDNTASNRVLTKLGFEHFEVFEYDGSECNRYRLKSS